MLTFIKKIKPRIVADQTILSNLMRIWVYFSKNHDLCSDGMRKFPSIHL